MEIEQQRKEIMMCMIEQDYFNLEAYTKEIEKCEQLKGMPSIFLEVKKMIIHKVIIEMIDKIISHKSSELK